MKKTLQAIRKNKAIQGLESKAIKQIKGGGTISTIIVDDLVG